MEKPDEMLLYSKVGMALISAQRVEFITKALVEHLAEFDKKLYGLTTTAFLEDSEKSKKIRVQTLGMIFKRLKLNPNLVIEDHLDEYLKMRNILVHSFWNSFLNEQSKDQFKKAVAFCNTFGRLSDRVESFFKGFLYFLQLYALEEKNIPINPETSKLEKDYQFFIEALQKKHLNDG